LGSVHGKEGEKAKKKWVLEMLSSFFSILFMVIKGGCHNMGRKQFPEKDFIAHLTQPFYHPFR
jgi:hypothetical protein